MKNLLILLIIFIYSASQLRYYSQNKDDIGSISISVVTPKNSELLSFNQLSKLRNRVLKIASSNSLSSSGFNTNFVLYPIFEIYDEEVVEGMQNITIVEAELSLFIKQVDNNLIFATHTMTLEGSGRNKSDAITNIIGDIPTRNDKLKNFITEGKNEIINYYEKNCAKIESQAITAAKMKNYEQAFNIIMSVPSEVSCNNKLQKTAISIYKDYQNHICQTNMLKAKTKISSQDYDYALNILANIDPASNCYAEAKKKISEIEGKVSIEKKREWEFKMKQYDDAVSLQKERINAIKEIAVAYYSQEPPTHNYMYIIR